MVKVNTSVAEKRGDCGEVGLFAVDVVFAGVVLEGFTRDDELGIGDNGVTATGLKVSVSLARQGI